jgi:hypothetical protein
MKKMALIALCAIVTSGMFAAAQDSAVDSSSEYLLLATNRAGTMQRELDDAAGRGFRVVAGLPGEDELVLILERVPQPAEPYAYRLLATHRTSTMERELNEAGRSGFRFAPLATIEKGDEIISIMERAPGTQVRYEYRLLATHRTSTLHRELNQAADDGFVLKGTFNRDERMAVLERVLN